MAKLRIPSLKRFTKRLEIRPLQMRDDRAWMASHCAMLPPKTPWEIKRIPLEKLSFSGFMKFLEEQKKDIQNDQLYTMGIFHQETGTLLGYAYISDISRGEKSSAVLDFRLINIYWGQGFAKEAITEILKLKSSLKLNELKLSAKAIGKLKL